MKLSITSWSLPQCSLKEVIGLSKLLEINAIDLGYFYRSALNKSDIINNPEKEAKKIVTYDIKVPCLYHLFGNSVEDQNLSSPNFSKTNIKHMKSVALFCSKASIDTVFLVPGIVNPGQSTQEAMEVSAENLKQMLGICQKEGVTLAVEPHVHSCLESPASVQELLMMIPGLKIVLDYAHFVCLGYTQSDIDNLIPFAQHVHLRQAKPGYLQASLENGVINFQSILGKLRDSSYGGFLAIEYVHQSYMNTLHSDVLSETIKMRDLVREWSKERVETID